MSGLPGPSGGVPTVPTGAVPPVTAGTPGTPAAPAAPAAPASVAALAPATPVAEVVITAPWTGSTDVWKVGAAGQERPWWESIAEQPVRDHIAAHQYKTPAELAMANYNLTKLQTGAGDVVALPKADAPPEAWNTYYEKIGRPKDANGYTDAVKWGDKPDQTFVDFGKSAFFDAGLTPQQAQKVVEKWNAFAATQGQQAQAAEVTANNTAVDTLLSSWGPELEANKAAGHRVIESLGKDAAPILAKIDAMIGAAPVIQLLAMIGKKSSEGGFVAPTGGGGNPNDPSQMSKEGATARIAALNADPAFNAKYLDKKHPDHAAAVQEMNALYARA